MSQYCVVLQCEGLPANAGAKAAEDVTAGFSRRDWHQKAVSHWDGKLLILTAENDFDRDGRATMDEFSDEISACMSDGFDSDIRIVSVTEIAADA